MRNVRLVNENRKARLRSKAAGSVARVLPHWIFRKLMESTFINFGVETTNLCNANCSFCGYRFMQRPKVDMPLDLYEKALHEYAASGGGNINFTPTVGDPLVDNMMVMCQTNKEGIIDYNRFVRYIARGAENDGRAAAVARKNGHRDAFLLLTATARRMRRLLFMKRVLALHHRSIYAYVHKHHHRQVVPSPSRSPSLSPSPSPNPSPA